MRYLVQALTPGLPSPSPGPCHPQFPPPVTAPPSLTNTNKTLSLLISAYILKTNPIAGAPQALPPNPGQSSYMYSLIVTPFSLTSREQWQGGGWGDGDAGFVVPELLQWGRGLAL